jgi:uncharacterized protein DUF4255/carboxypeptidase family protein
MLNDIHNALQRLLYDHGRMDAAEIDVKFEAPAKEWAGSLTRPTVNLFLFDIRENTEKRETNMQTIRGNGKAERRMAPRRIDLRYMVSALTTHVEDQHQLLWRLLSTLMKHPKLPDDVLPESLRLLDPPITTRVEEKDDSTRFLELWNAFATPPRPALSYIVTAPLDLEIAIEAPLVLTHTARYRFAGSLESEVEKVVHIGGVVRNRSGQPVPDITVKLANSGLDGTRTDAAGQFVLRGVSQGIITLTALQPGGVEKRVQVNVPSESYDILLDG